MDRPPQGSLQGANGPQRRVTKVNQTSLERSGPSIGQIGLYEGDTEQRADRVTVGKDRRNNLNDRPY